VLQIGLQGALLALKPLFGISVSGKSFFLLSSAVYFIFHPLYFLSGIPRDPGELDRRNDYPAVLRVFAQFILVPLVAVYQLLLTAYLVRIVVTGKWPSGLIGWLVSAEATFGVLALLLIHPVRDREENRWVRRFARGFYIALLPSLAMLALAIGKRVGQYGITEDRYFVAVLAAWLAGVSAYFILRRDGDIRWIPATLGLLAVFTLGGPWSAYSVSLASQSARLARLIHSHALRLDEPAAADAQAVSFQDRKDISSTLDYLFSTHGPRAVVRVLGPAADTSRVADAGRGAGGADRSRRIMARMGLVYVATYEGEQAKSFSFYAPMIESRPAEPLEGFEFHRSLSRRPPIRFLGGGRMFTLEVDAARRSLRLDEGLDPICSFPLERAIAITGPYVASTPDSNSGGMRIEASPGRGRGLLVVESVSGSMRDSLELYEIRGDLYFSTFPPPGVALSR